MSDTIKNVRLKDKDGNILHPEITVDTELNSTSENPVQNKVVKAALDAAYNPTNKEDLNKIGHDEKGNLTYNEVVVGGSSSITVDAELNSTSENPVQNKVINAKLDEVFQSVSNSNTRIETAITDMGGTVSKSGSVAKTGELISGLATVASAQANIFVQEDEPETKNGLWLKTSNTYDDIVNISGTENSVTYTKMTDIPYEFSYGCSAVAIGNDIYLLKNNNNYKYDTTANTYTKMTDIPYNFYFGDAVIIDTKVYLLGGQASPKFNYRIDFTILDKNSIVFLNSNMPFKHKTKMFNTPYGVLNYINFDSVIMTDENGKNANVEVYIGNGTEWTKITA